MQKHFKRISRKSWLRVLFVFLAISAGIALTILVVSKKSSTEEKKPGENAPLTFTPMDLVKIQQTAQNYSLTISGTIQPLRQSTVRAKVAGEIQSVFVREGDSVQAGQQLAAFDLRDLEDQLREKKGQVAASKAQLNWSEKNRATNETLLKQGFISSNRFDELQSNYQSAQGQLQSLEANLAQTERQLSYAQVASPITGTIAKRHVQPGEKVSYDAPLFHVVDLSELELQALVPASEVARIRTGTPVKIVVDSGSSREIIGKVARINPVAEAGTRSIYLYITLPNPDRSLRAGMFASGSIQMPPQDTAPEIMTTIARSAVQYEGSQAFLWVIENNQLTKKFVAIGTVDNHHDEVALKTALPLNTLIVAKPNEQLKAGRAAFFKTNP